MSIQQTKRSLLHHEGNSYLMVLTMHLWKFWYSDHTRQLCFKKTKFISLQKCDLYLQSSSLPRENGESHALQLRVTRHCTSENLKLWRLVILVWSLDFPTKFRAIPSQVPKLTFFRMDQGTWLENSLIGNNFWEFGFKCGAWIIPLCIGFLTKFWAITWSGWILQQRLHWAPKVTLFPLLLCTFP